MLIDMPRLARSLDRRFPPRPGSLPLLIRMERALAGYVKGQVLLSLIIGASAGLGLWLLDALGQLPGIGSYILLFAGWVAFTELIPYVGPWIGSIPPFIYAIFVHPISAIWITLLFLFLHQVEGHVVVPNVMGRAVRLHPLLVIFGLLGGLEINGMPGVFVALPLLAVARATWEFFSERVELQGWGSARGLVPVDVEVEVPSAAPTPPAAAEPPAAPLPAD
jgi:predicted PurR-regulated permease PerM